MCIYVYNFSLSVNNMMRYYIVQHSCTLLDRIFLHKYSKQNYIKDSSGTTKDNNAHRIFFCSSKKKKRKKKKKKNQVTIVYCLGAEKEREVVGFFFRLLLNKNSIYIIQRIKSDNKVYIIHRLPRPVPS